MALCKLCSTSVVRDGIVCDGICGDSFHPACLKRTSKFSTTDVVTCSECADIKPCHVLRFMRNITDSLISDQSFIAGKINNISSNWASLQLLSDDLNSFNGKLDKLLDTVNAMYSSSDVLMEKSHELTAKVLSMSATIDDLQMTLSNCDMPLGASGGIQSPIMPIIDDIRRSVKVVKGDLGNWCASANRNSELMSSIASDLRSLTALNRDNHVAVPPASSEAGVCVDPPAVTSVVADSPNPCSRSRRKRARQRNNINPNINSVSKPTGTEADNSGPAEDAPAAPECAAERDASGDLNSGTCHASGVAVLNQANTSVAAGLAVDVAGTVDAVTLRSAFVPRHVFVSRLHPDTTEYDVVCSLSSRLGVSSGNFNCKRIDKLRNSSSSFSASFKIIVPETVFGRIASPDFWPSGVIAREFVPRHRSSSGISSKNSLVKSPTTTLT